jgi:hypothetical protein
VRRPNIRSAGVDLAFAAAALILGWTGAPATYVAGAFLAASAAWAWTRQEQLARMTLAQRVTNGALALAMLAVVLGLAYWIGLALGGHT